MSQFFGGSQILILAFKGSQSSVHPTYLTFCLLSPILPELHHQVSGPRISHLTRQSWIKMNSKIIIIISDDKFSALEAVRVGDTILVTSLNSNPFSNKWDSWFLNTLGYGKYSTSQDKPSNGWEALAMRTVFFMLTWNMFVFLGGWY